VSSNKLVVVAISSSAIALRDITWGDVTLNDDGYLVFGGFSESLTSLKPSKPFAVPDKGKTFTSGELPTKDLGVHGADEASGDDPSDV
jgi:hypothetical protein